MSIKSNSAVAALARSLLTWSLLTWSASAVAAPPPGADELIAGGHLRTTRERRRLNLKG